MAEHAAPTVSTREEHHVAAFPSVAKAQEFHACRICADPATTFRDTASALRYGQAGLCQRCQDAEHGRLPEPRCVPRAS
jgi:hypothetical protein